MAKDMRIRIAGSPDDMAELESDVHTLGMVGLVVQRQARERDLAVTEILITAAVTGAVKSVYDLIKTFIAEKIKKPPVSGARSSFAIEVGDRKISIPADTDEATLTKLLETVLD